MRIGCFFSSSSLGSQSQDKVRSIREVLGVTPMKDQGKREQGSRREPSVCDEGLTALKGEGKGKRLERKSLRLQCSLRKSDPAPWGSPSWQKWPGPRVSIVLTHCPGASQGLRAQVRCCGGFQRCHTWRRSVNHSPSGRFCLQGDLSSVPPELPQMGYKMEQSERKKELSEVKSDDWNQTFSWRIEN